MDPVLSFLNILDSCLISNSFLSSWNRLVLLVLAGSCCIQLSSGDFGYDYFGFKTLEKSYLLRVHGKSVERPQHLIMRAACGIHCGDVAATVETYDLMSRKFFTHATPTLFNSGTPNPQMSSCFLLKMKEDSIEGIYDTLKQCALISKSVPLLKKTKQHG